MSLFIVTPYYMNVAASVAQTRTFTDEGVAKKYFLNQNAHAHTVKCYVCNAPTFDMPVEIEWSKESWKHPK